MKTLNSSTSLCRNCRYYAPEGRRGGYCSQLNVAVQSGWKACTIAIPPFTPNWESIEDIMLWQRKTLAIQDVRSQSHSEIESSPAYSEAEPELANPEPIHVASEQIIGIKALWM